MTHPTYDSDKLQSRYAQRSHPLTTVVSGILHESRNLCLNIQVLVVYLTGPCIVRVGSGKLEQSPSIHPNQISDICLLDDRLLACITR